MILSIIEKIKRRNLTIAVAESCTGGKVASTIVSNEGVSNIFLGGVVTYSDNSKVEILKIDKNKIQNYGAVSSEIAKDMSLGVSCLGVKTFFFNFAYFSHLLYITPLTVLLAEKQGYHKPS